jgi:hypothetical protein
LPQLTETAEQAPLPSQFAAAVCALDVGPSTHDAVLQEVVVS